MTDRSVCGTRTAEDREWIDSIIDGLRAFERAEVKRIRDAELGFRQIGYYEYAVRAQWLADEIERGLRHD